MSQFLDGINSFLTQTGFFLFGEGQNWKCIVMLVIAFALSYLAIVKKFEPMLLLPIAFGMLLTNLPGAEMFHEELFANGHINWQLFGGATISDGTVYTVLSDLLSKIEGMPELIKIAAATNIPVESFIAGIENAEAVALIENSAALQKLIANMGNSITPGIVDYLYLGVKFGLYPCIIFIGVGAMTDFGPLIANPKSLLLGAAAQAGIFATFAAARLFGFTGSEAASIGIIGGADGPTAIFTTSILAPHLLGPIAVAAYSYMALVPVIQPPIMRFLTTKKERAIVMTELRPVSKTQKILFPFIVTAFVALLVPSAAPLVGCLMLGNLFRETGVVERLSKTVQNELINIVTIFLGVSVGATATAATFLSWNTITIIGMGIVAFGVATAIGVLFAKFMNLFLKNKINPLIGSAGVSAVPMAARVSQVEGQKENPGNFLLMHAMGPNVAGVIGSAIAAGVLIGIFG